MADGVPLGPYRLVRRLALGGMAEIFLARREGPEGFSRELVVKRILPHLAADDEFVSMFLSEARLAAQLHHPNVVHVYDFGEADESYYLAMELVRGVDLRALIVRAASTPGQTGPGGGLPIAHAVKIASYVCEGLAHAHAIDIGGGQGVVHRDVTPSNVLLSFDGAVKLADFGIAKAERTIEKRETTEHGVVKGKQAYLSPEQARGEALDARSDLFNVGILLFESLLGEALYPQDDLRAARRLAASGQVPELERVDRLPPALARIVRRTLSPRPEDRPSDALALRGELEAYLRTLRERSDSVEIGRYVRALFADVHADEQPRAAGTVPMTALDSSPPSGPTGVATSAATIPRSAPRGGIAPPRLETTARSRGGRKIALALAALLGASLVLGALLVLVLWPDAPPRTPPLEPNAEPRPSGRVAAEPGQLRVVSEPSGALVRIDGREHGQAPLVASLASERSHRVEVTLMDGTTRVEEVELAAGEAREMLFVSAPPELALLRVSSVPSGATVEVGGEVAGRTPTEIALTPGRHRVLVRHIGYASVEEEVELERPGALATLSYALARERVGRRHQPAARTGQLSISTTPWSEVYLGGRHLGTTPLAGVSLPAGRHTLTLRHPGRPNRSEAVVIRAGETTRVRLAL